MKKPRKSAPQSATADQPDNRCRQLPWYVSTWFLATLGAAALYLSFPPVNWWPLAWVAAVPWLLLVRMEKLPGRKPYRWLYCVGLVHWLILVQWVRLGHWAAHFGWLALSLYLACYLPIFIALTRAALWRWRVPLIVAAPVAWVGLEAIRGWLLTGFSMALLGHTQINSFYVVQISDLGGAYLVSFVVMLVAAAIAELIPIEKLTASSPSDTPRGIRWWPSALAALAVVGTLAYGHWRLVQTRPESDMTPARVAMIQGSIDTNFGDPTLSRRMLEEYREDTMKALAKRPDVILWPESTLPLDYVEIDRSGNVEKGGWLPQDDAQFEEEIKLRTQAFDAHTKSLGYLGRDQHVPLLLGAGTLRLGDHAPQRLNSAIYVDEHGDVVDAYHKLHPVMFGEYAPGGKLFPWIYELMPIPAGLTPGDEAKSFEIAGLQMCPSICYENTVPHLMRRQVVELRRQRLEPDVLVTLSNDGWFHGSAELDMHLICGQFRAIELRKPALVAANTGFSAHIDDNGRLLARGPRQAREIVMAEVLPAWRSSFYAQWGDLFANACLLLTVAAGIASLVVIRRRNNRHDRSKATPSEDDR